MKVGTEIKSLRQLNDKIISTVRESIRSRRYGFFKAVFLGAILLNIVLLPINVSFNATASADTAFDPDPVHARQMEDMAKAVASGADQDPVHAQRVAEYYAAQQGGDTVPVQTTEANTADQPISAQAAAVQKIKTPAVAAPKTPATSAFYVNPNSKAAAQADAWRGSRPADAAKMDYLASQATAVWLGNWNGDVQSDVSKVASAAAKADQMPVFVAYNIPGRDCGSYSAGGSSGKDAYTGWIGALARGIGSRPATVILEPDALAGISCLGSADQQARTDMLASAVSILKSNGNTKVYLDAGHSGWIDAPDMADRLTKAGVAKADGFALNVSNFGATADEAAYGRALSQGLGGKHFVIDTSRNGNGSNGQWCNPSGRAVGQAPTANTGDTLVDAYLWLKTPGESDGTCNGGPSAGTWWPDYALSLVR